LKPHDGQFLAELAPSVASFFARTLDAGRFRNFFRTDGQMRTGIPGVYAAGDIARAPHNVLFAAADIMMAGLGVHHDLIGL
jgi:thioredoxin reductase